MLRRVLRSCLLAAAVALGGCELLDRDTYMPSEADRAVEARLQAAASRANRDVAITFDPARDAVVFDVTAELNAVRRDLVADHGLGAAWQMATDRSRGPEAIRLVPREVCDEADKDAAFKGGGGRADLLPGPQGLTSCLLATLETPPARAFRVSMTYEPLVSDEARIDRLRTFVEAPDGRRHVFEHYRLRGLPGPDVRAIELAKALN